MHRRAWVAIALGTLALAGLGWIVWMEWLDGCRPECPTHKLYVVYDGSVEEPIGHGAPRVKYERADLEREMPGLGTYLERSKAEPLVEVEDDALRKAVVAHFGFPDEDTAAPIEVEGHCYVVTWERLGDEE